MKEDVVTPHVGSESGCAFPECSMLPFISWINVIHYSLFL